MIQYNSHNDITEIHYNNHTIKQMYGCGGNLVWSGGTGPTPPTPYENQYLTFVIKSGGTITYSGSTNNNTIQYSLDSGATWSEPAGRTVTTPTLQVGDKVMWKGNMIPNNRSTATEQPGIGRFIKASTTLYEAEGNVMSLLFGDNFTGHTSLDGYNFAFFWLFTSNTNLLNAENLILPATTLASSCYYEMFAGCQYLAKAPELPAPNLTSYCYDMMFNNCQHLGYIKCLAETGINTNSSTTNWVGQVSTNPNNIFIKKSGVTWPTGVNGIPNGWTVVDDA